MQKKAKQKIVIIGCGNVAWHLAKHLSQVNIHEIFVYNHKPNSLLNDFKTKLKCTVEPNLNNIISDADFYFICVTDKFISGIAKKIKIKNTNAIVVHTSGSAKIDDLGNEINSAVFYPLQSFSKQVEVNWSEIPIIIEANSRKVKNKIFELAVLFSKKIVNSTYKERLKLHLAAVFVNNFTNSLFVVAEDLIKKNSSNNKLELLFPLIKQTISKIEKIDPRAAQTGPAKRNDKTVMKKHLKLLSENSDLKKLYKQLSSLIVKQQTENHVKL